MDKVSPQVLCVVTDGVAVTQHTDRSNTPLLFQPKIKVFQRQSVSKMLKTFNLWMLWSQQSHVYRSCNKTFLVFTVLGTFFGKGHILMSSYLRGSNLSYTL